MKSTFFVSVAIIIILGQLVFEGTYVPIFFSLLGILANPAGVFLVLLFILYHYFVFVALIGGFRFLFTKKKLSRFQLFSMVIAVFCNPASFLFTFTILQTLK